MRFSPKSLVAVLALSTFAFGAAKADTVGNSFSNTSTLDGCGSCEYLIGQPFGAGGETVTTYSFFAGNLASITPVLFTGIDNGNGTTTFTEIGVGTTQTSFPLGVVDTFDFGLLPGGTDVTSGTNTYFGFFNTDGPVVTYNYVDPTPNGGIFLIGTDPGLGNSATISNGDSGGGFLDHDSQNDQNDRLYALTATAVTPEPGTLSLLGTGLAGLAALRRRLKK